jgi:hypothetical protein
METVRVVLPHGTEAEIRSPRGRDELELAEAAGRTTPIRLATALLARCLVRLGEIARPGEEVVRGLALGDRDALLLHLRRHTFGDRMSCVVACPGPDCGRPMDVELMAGQLLDRPLPSAEQALEVVVADQRARFWVPRVADIEAGADRASSDPDGAVQVVLDRCVERVDPAGSRPCPELVDAIEERIMEADPFACTVLSLACPECGHAFRVPFDPADYFLRELAGPRGQLFEDVHQLAFHYHWSESDILDLPRDRRLRYLDLVADALGVA